MLEAAGLSQGQEFTLPPPSPLPAPDGFAGQPAADLQTKLSERRFVVSVEVTPPRGINPRRVIKAAGFLRNLGADCVNVPDNPMAVARMSAIATACLIRAAAGIEPIVHFSTRDRNLLALHADLMGAHALGLRNVLCIKGDPPTSSSESKPTAVWDLGAAGLLKLIKGLNPPEFESRTVATPFLVGAALDPTASDFEAEIRLARRKISAGADFFVTQAVFEPKAVERLLDAMGPLHPPILLGIWPLHSLRQALFLRGRVLALPEWLLDVMQKAGPDGEEAGTEVALSLLERVSSLVQGVYLIPSFGRFERVGGLVVAAKQGSRR